MGPSEPGTPWKVKFALGTTVVPRVTATRGDDVVVTRHHNADGTYDVAVRGDVVTVAPIGECLTMFNPARCPDHPGAELTAFGGDISDFGQWTHQSQLNDFAGMDTWTNVEVTDVPPTIYGDPMKVWEQLVNSHWLASGELFEGFYDVVLPNRLLRNMGVDDPRTLTARGLAVKLTNPRTSPPGSSNVSVVPGVHSTEVDATGITLWHRRLVIRRGTITPKAPRKVHARRVSATETKIRFVEAKPRGSRISGYQARCRTHGQLTRRGSAKGTPLFVNDMKAKRTYWCQVRAKSTAGHGKWSKRDQA
jgi:hypothetical protein